MTLCPAPYDTGRFSNDQADFCGCNCNTHNRKKRNFRVPFHEIMSEPLELRMVKEKHLENETVKNILKEGNEMCSKKCSGPFCDSYYSLIDALGYFKGDIGLHRLVLAAKDKVTIKIRLTSSL